MTQTKQPPENPGRFTHLSIELNYGLPRQKPGFTFDESLSAGTVSFGRKPPVGFMIPNAVCVLGWIVIYEGGDARRARRIMPIRAMEILLVPGFMLDAGIWCDVRPALQRYCDVIDVDTTQDSSIGAMADRAISSMAGPAIVIGFSMGGYVAREIAYRAPNLIHGLALVATSSRGSDPRPTTRLGQKGFRELSRSAVVRSLHPDHRSEELITRVQRMSNRLGGKVFQRQSRLRRDDDTARLREIVCPTLVVAAAQDELRSIDESRTLHDHIPGSTMTIIERTGHLIPLEQPEKLITAFTTTFERLFSAEG